MPAPKAQKIVLTFEDGSQAEASFGDLPATLQADLLSQPFAAKASPDPEEEKFVLLQWDDGWKEVLKVDQGCQEINRYYVISRVEEVGRLSLKQDGGYPELIEIVRKPRGLKKVTFLGTFELALESSKREGKKEDHFFSLSKQADALSQEVEAFKRAAGELGLDPQEIAAADSELTAERCRQIGEHLGLKASRRQQDLQDFMVCLARSA